MSPILRVFSSLLDLLTRPKAPDETVEILDAEVPETATQPTPPVQVVTPVIKSSGTHLTATQSELLTYVKDYSPVETNGLDEISGILQMSEGTVSINLRKLEEMGAVSITRTPTRKGFKVSCVQFVSDRGLTYSPPRTHIKIWPNRIIELVQSRMMIGETWVTTWDELSVLAGPTAKTLSRQIERACHQNIIEAERIRDGTQMQLVFKRLR